jgi:hypothetical protein
MDLTNIVGTMPYHDFLNNYKSKLKTAFYERADLTQFIQQRGFPSLVWREIMSAKPLSVSIPKKYGGRGINVKECLGVFEASGYESLALSLTFGINFALFMEPVAKYGSESLKPKVFERFLNQANMGGLMITEPSYGSDALNMQTFNVKEGSNYKIKGIKHWQGLTGLADYWLMTSRSKSESGKLSNGVSTRTSVEMAGLMYDGFGIDEAAEVCVYPQFADDGGMDSERTFIKQLVQKYVSDGSSDDLFNEDEVEDMNYAS